MEINVEIYDKIKHVLPVQRGNVNVENIRFINALLYICENSCKSVPPRRAARKARFAKQITEEAATKGIWQLECGLQTLSSCSGKKAAARRAHLHSKCTELGRGWYY